jgi:multisubunit Na+/H+ antiporter MnhC subunit
MPKAATVIAMAVIVDAIVDVAVNAASGQQAQLPMRTQTQRAHAKQNPVKKAVVVIAMVAPIALKAHARMQTP